jgi:hypothetical protein
MIARRIPMLIGLVTAAAAGWYFFKYLTKWEWNRALVAAAIFLALEIALVGAAMFERMRKLDRSLTELRQSQGRRAREPRADVLMRVREAAPTPRNPFAWLTPDRSNVFIPVLLGAGVIMSGIAWVVEKLARATAGPQLERGLAVRLEALAPPAGGLLARDHDPLALFTPTGGATRSIS